MSDLQGVPAGAGIPFSDPCASRSWRPVPTHGTSGFTLIELLVVVAIVGILSAVAMVGYRSARVRGGAAVAVATLESINQAQFLYMQTCANQRYAPTLASLGRPVPGSGVPFLSPDLTEPEPLMKAGYRFEMSGSEPIDATPTCTGETPVVGYQAVADPIDPGADSGLHYGTNADRVIFSDRTTFAGNMPETGAPAHGTEIKSP